MTWSSRGFASDRCSRRDAASQLRFPSLVPGLFGIPSLFHRFVESTLAYNSVLPATSFARLSNTL